MRSQLKLMLMENKGTYNNKIVNKIRHDISEVIIKTFYEEPDPRESMYRKIALGVSDQVWILKDNLILNLNMY